MGNADARDVASYFKQLGAKFPEGSFAVYQPKSRVLVIHNTDDNLQMDDQLAGGAGFRQALVELELSAIECSLPPGTNPLSMPPLAYSDLERLPAKSVKLLDRISSTSKSGQRIYATHVVNPATGADTTSNEPGKFAPGEWGTHAETESNVGSDGCDVNIDFRFRKQLDDHDPKTLLEIYFDCTFLCREGQPVVLNVSAAPGVQDGFVAIVARTRVVNRDAPGEKAGGKHAGDALRSTHE